MATESTAWASGGPGHRRTGHLRPGPTTAERREAGKLGARDHTWPRPRARRLSKSPGVWPAAAIAPESVQQLPVLSVVVATNGSASAIERARTVLEATFPAGRFPSTVGECEADFARTLVQWQQLANVVILASLPIAGCSLAVSVAGGLSERKRPFSMLRLTGVQLGVLRRVVVLESAVPLLVVAVLTTGAGFLAAQLFLTSQMDYSLRPPESSSSSPGSPPRSGSSSRPFHC